MSPAIGIDLVLDGEKTVDDDILHAWHQVSGDLHLHTHLSRKVGLEILVAKSVTLLKLTVCALLLKLQALIGQVHNRVCSIKVVERTARPQVARLVIVNLIFRSANCPHADVKLAVPVKEWPLDVLLHHALGPSGPAVDVAQHCVPIGEHLDAATLIGIRRLDQPHVMNAMFHWHLLFGDPASLDLLEARLKILELLSALPRLHDESCWGRIKLTVCCRLGRRFCVVILSQAPYKSTLRPDAV